MIGSTARRRLLQSTRAAAHDRFRQQCGKRTLRSGLVGTTPPVHMHIDFYRTQPWNLTPRLFFSSDIPKHNNTTKHNPPRFEDLDLHPRTLKALRRQGIHKQTEVQAKTFDTIRSGKNVVTRSRTGTGKTLAFLVPTLERYLNSKGETTPGIPILILAPTRELAAQIGKEAEKLLAMHKHHHKLSSQVVYGGSSKQDDISKFKKGLPTILVATPGRLKDHLATTTLTLSYNPADNGENDRGAENPHLVPFRSLLQNGNLQTLILDETDRLLEMGFRRDVQDIVSCLNDDTSSAQSRQTLLFSATLSPGIMDVVDIAMPNGNKDYETIDCVDETDLATHTNINTTQSCVVLPPERFWTGSLEFIVQLLTESQKKKPKIIVFFELTRLAQLYTKFLSLRLGHTQGVWELHGKMHQRERTLTTRRFRNAPHGVLLTSDVSARGVDYPDVTHVVQVGAPQNRETYIHRLGRTGRAGKEGAGFLIIPEHERDFVGDLEGLGLTVDASLQKQLGSRRASSKVRREIDNELGMLQHDLQNGGDHTGMGESLKLAYHSLVSYYFQTRRQRQSQNEGSSLNATVTIINQLIHDFGLPELPAIGFQRAKNLGIDHLSGHLNIRKDWEDQNVKSSNSEKRSNHGDFDDWFGLGADASPPKQKPRRHKQGNDIIDSKANNFAKQNLPRTKRKKKESHFDDGQRFNSVGKVPK